MSNHVKLLIVFILVLLSVIQIACVISTQGNTNTLISPTTVKIEVATSTYEPHVLGYNHIRDFTSSPYLDIVWSPNDHRFLVVTINDLILYDADTLEIIWKRLPQSQGSIVSGAVFTSDGKNLILYDNVYGLQIISANDGSLIYESKNPLVYEQNDCQPLYSAQTILTPDDKTLIISTENPEHGFTPQIQLWDIDSFTCKEVLAETEGHNRSLDLSSDGRYLANGSGLNTSTHNNDIVENGSITVWDMLNKEPICEISDHGAYARFLTGESLLAVPDPEKNEIAYWDVTKCAVDTSLPGVSSKYGFAFNPDGQSIALWNGDILIIDSEQGDILQVIDDPAKDMVFAITRINNEFLFSHDGQYLIYTFVEKTDRYKFTLWKYEE